MCALVCGGALLLTTTAHAQTCLNTENNSDVALGEVICAWGWVSKCEDLGNGAAGLVQVSPRIQCNAGKKAAPGRPELPDKKKREVVRQPKPVKQKPPADMDELTDAPNDARVVRSSRAQCLQMKGQHARALGAWERSCRNRLVPTETLAAELAQCDSMGQEWSERWREIGRMCPEYSGRSLGSDGSVK